MEIRQNKTSRRRNLITWQQCSDCGLADKHTDVLEPGQQYEILQEAVQRKQCPNPGCKSKNWKVGIQEQDIENNLFQPTPFEGKQGKYRNVLLEGRSVPNGCDCGPFKEEMEFKAGATGEMDWEPTLPVQICPNCNKQYHLDWTVTERTYL